MRLLGWFIPEEWWPWVLLGLTVGWLVGLVRLRTLAAVGTLILLGPLIEAWLDSLPGWVRLGLVGLVLLALLRDVLAFFLGDRAADHAVGDFTGYLLRLAFWTLTLPLRMATWLARRTLRQERMP
ncbi:MAG: hypothetical protein QN153_12110 [Armatimonadota bacterium]|nr:hypothetical protein [Armatimonadota bacterium]